jgi:hypothetical protein
VDLEEFYNDDPRRRHSAELEFGRDWTDGDSRCEISWVEDTGELYVMLEPEVGYAADGIGGMHSGRPSVHALRIEILGNVTGREAVEALMSGYEQAMSGPNSLAWVRDRVAHAASTAGDTPAEPSDDLPEH